MNLNFHFPLILASNSPRRQLLLKEAGINFLVKSKDVAEDYPSSMAIEDVPVYL
ncbi:MAG TPA: Maf family protein, partial [Cytophagaceae bacterium]